MFRFLGEGGRTWWHYMYLKSLFQTWKFRWTHWKCSGKYPDKTFYVIGVDFHDDGLMAIVNYVMGHIEYALDRGYIPVVNMKDFQSIYQKANENAWELFFEQPCGYTLSDIYEARNVIISMNVAAFKDHYTRFNDSERKEKYKRLYKEYFRPNKKLQLYLNEVHNKVKLCKGEIIACICRGTDYNNTLVGIDKQPTVEMVIEKVKEFMVNHNISNVYCATEDERIYAKFENVFGDRLIPNTQQKYGDNKGKLLAKVNVEQGIDVFKIAYQYYQSLYLVSQCDYLVAGMVSGTTSVLLMPNNFKDVFIFNLGVVTEEDIKVNASAAKYIPSGN